MTFAEWEAEGTQRFGPEKMDWRFVCPACGHVASTRDYKDAGAPSSAVGFSCIGRWLGATGSPAFTDQVGGPCNYSGGGLFHLNPVRVETEGAVLEVFAFAEVTQ